MQDGWARQGKSDVPGLESGVTHEGEDVGPELIQGALVAVRLGRAGSGLQGKVEGDGVGGRQDGEHRGHAVRQLARVVHASLGTRLGMEPVRMAVADGYHGLPDGSHQL